VQGVWKTCGTYSVIRSKLSRRKPRQIFWARKSPVFMRLLYIAVEILMKHCGRELRAVEFLCYKS